MHCVFGVANNVCIGEMPHKDDAAEVPELGASPSILRLSEFQKPYQRTAGLEMSDDPRTAAHFED